VSSGALQSEVGLGLSSASIRHVLHGLEEKGLLQQPHTSAGRVPSAEGYRLFVDLCLRPARLPQSWQQRIEAELQHSRDTHELLQRVSRLLAGMSSNVGVGLALPSEALPHIRSIELVGLESERVMAVVTLDNNIVRTEILALERSLPAEVLEAAARLLSNIVCDRTPAAARQHLDRALQHETGDVSDLARDVARRKERVFADWPHPSLHLQGASEIMAQPEFTDPRTLRLLVQLLDHPENLESVLLEQARAGASITIGEESKREDLSPFSLVIASCKVAGQPGFVGILGRCECATRWRCRWCNPSPLRWAAKKREGDQRGRERSSRPAGAGDARRHRQRRGSGGDDQRAAIGSRSVAAENAKQRDQLLRLAADYDNFRKRSAREWQEQKDRAAAEVLREMLELADKSGPGAGSAVRRCRRAAQGRRADRPAAAGQAAPVRSRAARSARPGVRSDPARGGPHGGHGPGAESSRGGCGAARLRAAR
jgi:heat-inducible transcriptional repressor